jgi:hypothetical protein
LEASFCRFRFPLVCTWTPSFGCVFVIVLVLQLVAVSPKKTFGQGLTGRSKETAFKLSGPGLKNNVRLIHCRGARPESQVPYLLNTACYISGVSWAPLS